MLPTLYAPLERLLTSGGDTRLEIEPNTGRNRYACLPRPSAAVPFGSCTSSSISARGLAAAMEAHHMICGSPDSHAAASEFANTVRRRLRELLTLPDGVDIALAPSGTDVEMLALALAAGSSGRPVVNILVGPGEVGSGTPQAAACCHYDELTPSGARVVAGTPVDPVLASLVDVRTVDLRTANGEMHSESEIDAAVIELFVEASEADAIVLLHIVAHSKTGVHAPSLACVERLRKISNDVVVVVDAAQGRFSRRGLREVLQNDYLVMFTGSKFYGGPPFSGALLVPSKFRPANRGLEQISGRFCRLLLRCGNAGDLAGGAATPAVRRRTSAPSCVGRPHSRKSKPTTTCRAMPGSACCVSLKRRRRGFLAAAASFGCCQFSRPCMMTRPSGCWSRKPPYLDSGSRRTVRSGRSAKPT